ncbi:MAG: lactonase family protein [Polyangiales bacterium]|nr:lactonase family protein [Myxococcales bacterium]
MHAPRTNSIALRLRTLVVSPIVVGLFLVMAACGGSDSGRRDGGGFGDASEQDGADTHDGQVPSDANVSKDASDGAAPDTRTPVVYVGGYAGVISWYAYDRVTGALTLTDSLNTGGSPSFLAVDSEHLRLFSANESGAQVHAYAMDATTGALTHINGVSSGGAGPAHVAVHPSGKWVFVANYTQGNMRVIPVGNDGVLGTATDTRSVGANAHQVLVSSSGDRVYVPCKGADHVAQFSFNSTTGTLTALSPATVSTANGAGPRHMAFHPTLARAYLINELDSTMVRADVDAGGRLTLGQTLSTLPNGFGGTNKCAEVAVHPSGAFLYGSNRGHNSIVTYALGGDGAMTLVGREGTGGSTPRSFTLDPAGKFLLAANQDSNNVVVFSLSASTGEPSPTGQSVTVSSPSFVGFGFLP